MFEYLMPLLVMPTYENTLWTKPTKRSCGGRSTMGSSGGYLGEFPSPGSTHGMCTWTTSIGPLAYRGLD